MYQLFCNDNLIASAKYKQAIERHIVSVIDNYAEQGYTILNEDNNRVELISTNGDQINLTVGFVNDDPDEINNTKFNNIKFNNAKINDNSTNYHVNNGSNDNDNNEQYIRKEITHMEQDKTTKINKQDETTTTNNETVVSNNEVETVIKDSPNTESINAEQSQAEINNSATTTSNENIPQQNVDQSNINNNSNSNVEPNQEESQNSNTKENINPVEEFDNRVATKIIEILSSQEYNYGNILSAFCANQISSMLVSSQLKPYFIQLNNAILNGKTSIMMEFAINGSNTIDIKYILAFCHMLMYLKYQLTFKSNSQVLIVQINW